VLQIVPRLDSGGAERTTIDIARALVKDGCRALVLSEGGRLEADLERTGAELIRMPVASKNPLAILKNAGRIAHLVTERNISLVHARSRAPAWSAFLAAKRAKVPLVTTYHGIYRANGTLKCFYNSIMARGDVVIANSEWTAAHIRTVYPRSTARVVVIPRGIDLSVFDADRVSPLRVARLRAAWRACAQDRVLLLASQVTRRKAQALMISALARLKHTGRLPANLRVVMAGDANGHAGYVQELTRTIASNGFERIAILVGHVTDMPAAYVAADFVAAPSNEPEAFGRVPVEAALMGRAVIATDHGGAQETVLHGKSGLLVPPYNVEALAEAIAELCSSSPERLKQMAEIGRAHATRHYALEKMCASTLGVYRRLLDSAAAARGTSCADGVSLEEMV
jgi:glycosyltransferase involved in cell wall biosynthesis